MTFTILGRGSDTLAVGVVSGSVEVGNRVPWIKGGVGAVATQGYTRTFYGRDGLKLLEKGEGPEHVLERLRGSDPAPEKRQVAILDAQGRHSAFTGARCPDERGTEDRKNCICIGNYLKNKDTLLKMANSFGENSGDFLDRVLKAMEAGRDAGGDKRGNRTAAILIKGRENVEAGVDESETPLRDLKKKLKEF